MLVVSFTDMFAIVLVAPLGLLVTGSDARSGAWRILWELAGRPDNATYTIWLLIVILASFIVKDILAIGVGWWQSGFTARQLAVTQSRLIRYYAYIPWQEYVRRGQADFLNRISNVSQVYAGVAAGVSLFSQSASVVAVLVALMLVNRTVTIAILAYFALIGVAYLRLSNRLLRSQHMKRVWAELDQQSLVLRIFGGAKEIRVRDAQRFFVDQFSRQAEKSAQITRKANFVLSLPKFVLEIAMVVALIVLILVTVLTGQAQSLVPSLALVAIAAFRVLPTLAGAIGSANQIAAARTSIDLVNDEMRALELYERRLADEGSRDTIAFTGGARLTSSLELRGISFQYREDLPLVLRDINIKIEAGTSVAIVGASGAGKSTLADIILGLVEPSAGRILCDGHDIDTDSEAWRQNVGMVPQTVYVMDSDIVSNVAFDALEENCDVGKVWRALAAAELAETVAALEDGIHTQMGDQGVRLSGGQKQRLGIARALYRDPALLVLDEATSALDNETERRISNTIDALTGEITVVIIAHRLSTIRRADQVVFLEGGTVAAAGSFEEVRRKSAAFAELVRLGDVNERGGV